MSDTRSALVDGRSRRADGFCSGLRRSVNASRTPCASCGTSAITRCVRCRIVRMWWPGPWDRAVRSGWLLLDLAMTTMHRPRSVDCQVLIHSRSVGPRCSSTSRLIGGGVGVEGNGECTLSVDLAVYGRAYVLSERSRPKAGYGNCPTGRGSCPGWGNRSW
jgi:hypothetical protein